MEPETLRGYVSENRELEKQLTKRNQQYIFDLKKSLEAANLSEEEKAIALHEILPILVKEQKGGRTARQLFGTVSERTEAILNKPEEVKETKPVMMWLDNTLLILGIFGIMMGIMGLFARDSAQVYGIITFISMAMVGGWVFYIMYKYMYQYERPGADKSQRPKMWKIMLILMGSFFLWIATIAVTSLLPTSINIVLDPIILAVIGAVAIGLRYYLKKKYNIVGSLSVPRK
ncbi:DUF1129 domain-containing protein [Enterococcus saccharolyticus]|uniref:Integral membrane protein n=1 Tax=Enterococcus saccharolyticus subsp. saccharolyticus ATCC 43076 TaxID=1139996 RepID=S0J075_9ENTE|nr:DUF1129 domain-containing protein [Enterococcus saccharolyticus]EOT26214.1 hypothetical protein OMQ_02263 [Enterococcus saccharolyticus subsp. saccharolyticus ATCC 43076]EOT82839.1 hypothetical protein I572_00379 [Enterococcus saccharolyticus subsp. saccharolyticus ATCC 43076]OJG91201.1 hypothetical protein RV16_GL000187 [Enterococcus saccharolyticus]